MKRSVSFCLLCAILISLFLFTACESNPIIGKWVPADLDEYNPPARAFAIYPKDKVEEMDCNFRFVNNSTIWIAIQSQNAAFSGVICKYSLKNDVLTISYDNVIIMSGTYKLDGDSLTYRIVEDDGSENIIDLIRFVD